MLASLWCSLPETVILQRNRVLVWNMGVAACKEALIANTAQNRDAIRVDGNLNTLGAAPRVDEDVASLRCPNIIRGISVSENNRFGKLLSRG